MFARELLLPVKGHLQIAAIKKDGSKTIVVDDRNLIVDNALNILRKAISNTDYQLTHLVLGINASGTPLKSQTRLVEQVLAVPFSEIIYVGNNEVRFNVMIDYNVGNGIVFTEAGLSAENAPEGERLFAVKRHGGVMKNNELVLEYNWSIIFQ